MSSYCLFIYLLSPGKGEQFAAFLQHQGTPGATLFRAKEKDTFQLNLYSSRSYKDMVWMIASEDEGDRSATLVELTASQMSFEKPCLYLLPLEALMSKRQGPLDGREIENMDKIALIAIVEKDHAHFVVDAIEKTTPFKGTLLKGEGTGHQAMLMPLSVEVNKDVVLAFVDEKDYKEIEERIEETLRLKDEGKGILMRLLAKEVY